MAEGGVPSWSSARRARSVPRLPSPMDPQSRQSSGTPVSARYGWERTGRPARGRAPGPDPSLPALRRRHHVLAGRGGAPRRHRHRCVAPAQALGEAFTLLPPGHVSELVMARLGGLLGGGGAQPVIQELVGAIRKLLELLATTGPLVLFDAGGCLAVRHPLHEDILVVQGLRLSSRLSRRRGWKSAICKCRRDRPWPQGAPPACQSL